MKKKKDHSNLGLLSIEQILKSFDFSHRFYVRFATKCAIYALKNIKDPDERSLRAVDLAERFGNGEDIAQNVLEEAAASAAYAATSYATYTAYAASSATTATYATYAASSAASSAASYATYTASSAASATSAATASITAELKEMLIQMIKSEFCKVELLLLGIDI